MRKYKIVVDTNIFIRGMFFPMSHPYCMKITKLIKSNKYLLVFSQESIGELMYIIKRNILVNNYDYKDSMTILTDITNIFYNGEIVNTVNTMCPKLNDKRDEMFVKTAIRSNADYIVSDDFNSGMHDIKDLNVNVLDSKKFVDTDIVLNKLDETAIDK